MKRNIFDIVLEFYHSPLEHPELMDATVPLPLDIGCLLDAISENKDPDQAAESPSELSENLRTAILFFIERSFFAPGADCYRVLGLGIGARADQVRKHYNQLLHIFSLDRLDKAGEWDATFATQINRAYSVLRDAERRRAYDQMLMRPSVIGEATEPVRGERTTEVARAIKSAPKVSYLASTKLAEDKQTQETQRRVLKETSVAGDKAVIFQGMGAASSAPLKSSFIANRIDRASGITTDNAIPDLGVDPEIVAGGRPQAEPEFIENTHEHFPVGIPASGPRVASHNRFLSMNRSSLVLLAAVILVLIVYAIVLPSRLLPQPGPAHDEVVSDRTTNGNVIRENTAGSSDVSAVDDSANPEDVAALGNDVQLSKFQSEASMPAGVSGPGVKSDNTLMPSDSLSDESQGTDIGHDDQRAQKSPRPIVMDSLESDHVATRAAGKSDKAASNSKKVHERTVGSEDMSPAKKLESMRQTLQKDSGVDNHVSGISGQFDTQMNKAAGGVPGAAQMKSVAQSMSKTTTDQLMPKTASVMEVGQDEKTAGPASSISPTASISTNNPSIAEVSTVASIAPAAPALQPQSITIGELDGLVDTFSKAYEDGDLGLLLTLFSDDARTNDQTSRAGIAKDYQDLFEISDRRKFIIDRLRWEQDKAGILKGEGDFQADVQLKNNNSVTSVKGKVLFYVKRGADGIVITQMLHSYN
jgi:hypothetical protein